MRREDLRDIEELRGVHEGRPEGRNEQEDEEDSSVLSGVVVGAEVGCLQGCFADECHEDAGQADKEEFAAAEFLNEEGAEDVAGEG